MPAVHSRPASLPGHQPDTVLRVAGAADAPIPSPVHRLQADLWSLEGAPCDAVEPKYPGWVRLGFPVIASIALWTAILWGAGLFG